MSDSRDRSGPSNRRFSDPRSQALWNKAETYANEHDCSPQQALGLLQDAEDGRVPGKRTRTDQLAKRRPVGATPPGSLEQRRATNRRLATTGRFAATKPAAAGSSRSDGGFAQGLSLLLGNSDDANGPKQVSEPTSDVFARATSGTPGQLPFRAQMEQAFGASLGDVQAFTGRGVLGEVGANAAAKGDSVAFAGDSPSRAEVAHEVTHVMQQRRHGVTAAAASRDVSDTSDASEREADHNAAIAAYGLDQVYLGAEAIPTARVHLERSAKPSEGVKTFRVDGDRVVINTAWLRSDPGLAHKGGQIYAPARMQEILAGLKTAGTLAWLLEADMGRLSRVLAFATSQLGKKSHFTAELAPAVLQVTGLPPHLDVYCRVLPDGGLLIAASTAFLASRLPTRGRLKTPPALMRRYLAEVEARTGVEISARRKRAFLARPGPPVHVARLREAWLHSWTRKQVERDLYDKAQWARYLADGTGDGKKDVGGKSAGFTTSVSEADQTFYQRWMQRHRIGDAKGGASLVDHQVIHALRTIDAHPAQKETLLKRLRSSPAGQVTGSSLLQLITAIEHDQANALVGRSLPRKSKTKALFNEPVFGEIINRGGLIFSGRGVYFSFNVLNTRSAIEVKNLLAPDVGWDIDWVAHPKGDASKQLARERTAQRKASKETDFFNVTFQTPGVFTVHAFVTHTWYLPAHFSIEVEVKTQAERLKDQRTTMSEGLAENVVERPKDFDLGFWSESLGKYKHDHGKQYLGKLPAGFKRKSAKQRKAFIVQDRQRVLALIKAYEHSHFADHKALIKYARRYLKTLTDAENRLDDVKASGYTFFEARGAFLSDRNSAPDGPLTLVGAAKRLDSGAIRVKIHDHTKLTEPKSYYFSAKASTLTNAVDAVFLDLCKSYPPGRISIVVELLDKGLDKSSGRTYGLQLHTGTAWKDFKEVVFDPMVNIAVNFGGAVAMIMFPAAAPLLFPFLAGYNATQVVDHGVDLHRKGILGTKEVAMGALQIMTQLVPYVGGARLLGRMSEIGRIFAIEGATFAAGMAVVTVDGLGYLRRLRNLDVQEIAQEKSFITELERTNKADPTLALRKQKLEGRINKLNNRAGTIIKKALREGAIMLVTPIVFAGIQAAGRRKSPTSMLEDGALLHKAGAKPHYDKAKSRVVADTNALDASTMEPAQKSLEADIAYHNTAVARLLNTNPDHVVIKFSKDSGSSVMHLADGGFVVTVGKDDPLLAILLLVRQRATLVAKRQPGAEPSGDKAGSKRADEQPGWKQPLGEGPTVDGLNLTTPARENAIAAASRAGMTVKAALAAFRIAQKHNVIIQVRDANPMTPFHREAGHSPKFEAVKMKTITRLDVEYLGAPKDSIGLVGYFEPKLNRAKLAELRATNPEQAAKVEARYRKRRNVYNGGDNPDVLKLIAEKKIRVEGGLIIDARKDSKGYGKAIAGDHDLLAITNTDGSAVSAKKNAQVVADLMLDPAFAAEHPALVDWKPKTKELSDVRAGMLKDHELGGEDSATAFHPDGTFGTAHVKKPK